MKQCLDDGLLERAVDGLRKLHMFPGGCMCCANGHHDENAGNDPEFERLFWEQVGPMPVGISAQFMSDEELKEFDAD